MKTTLKLQSHCVYDTRYHLILPTHKRKNLLTPRVIARLEALARERTAAWDGEVLTFQAEPDHVSLHISLPPTASVAGFVGALKTGTSRRLRNEFASLARSKRVWSDRYLVLSANGIDREAAIAAFLAGDLSLTTGARGSASDRDIVNALHHLSPSAVDFAHNRPNDARLVVAAALEAAARQYASDTNGNGHRRSHPKAGTSKDEFIDASEAARRLGISRGSIYSWVKTGKLIAWPQDRRGSLAIPAGQITKEGRVREDIPEILEAEMDPQRAWAQLSVKGA